MTEIHLSRINVEIINVCVYVAIGGRKPFLTKLQLSLTGNAVHSIKFNISSLINEVNKNPHLSLFYLCSICTTNCKALLKIESYCMFFL